MPECVSIERQLILKAFGAEIVLTPAKEGTDGAIRRAQKLHAEEPTKYHMPNQFENENNILAHYETTGPEISSQTKGEIDVFVAGMGTTGTLMGVGGYLKEKTRSQNYRSRAPCRAYNPGTQKYGRIHCSQDL